MGNQWPERCGYYYFFFLSWIRLQYKNRPDLLPYVYREGEKEREKEREREMNLWKVDSRKELQKEKETYELEVG